MPSAKIHHLSQSQLVTQEDIKNRNLYTWNAVSVGGDGFCDTGNRQDLLIRCSCCGAYNSVEYRSDHVAECADCGESEFEVMEKAERKDGCVFSCKKLDTDLFEVTLHSAHSNGKWRYTTNGNEPTKHARMLKISPEGYYYYQGKLKRKTLVVKFFYADGSESQAYQYSLNEQGQGQAETPPAKTATPEKKTAPNIQAFTCNICNKEVRAQGSSNVTCRSCGMPFEKKQTKWQAIGMQIKCTCGQVVQVNESSPVKYAACQSLVYFDTSTNDWKVKQDTPPLPALFCKICKTLTPAPTGGGHHLCAECKTRYSWNNYSGNWMQEITYVTCPDCKKEVTIINGTSGTCQCPHSFVYNKKTHRWECSTQPGLKLALIIGCIVANLIGFSCFNFMSTLPGVIVYSIIGYVAVYFFVVFFGIYEK